MDISSIKKRWQEYRDELYKKDLHHPDNHDDVITNLEPDILKCEVKWALGSITTNKASRSDGIPVELFQILKDDAVKVLYSICQQIWKTQQWPLEWKRSLFIPIPKKGNAKTAETTTQLHSSHMLVLSYISMVLTSHLWTNINTLLKTDANTDTLFLTEVYALFKFLSFCLILFFYSRSHPGSSMLTQPFIRSLGQTQR